MEIEIERLSQEPIKPSSPTPNHLRNYQLSFIDQIQPPIFMPLLMFYPERYGSDNVDRCNQIKTSLSDALSVYYPLAGRIRNDNNNKAVVDCNDEGVLFVESRANCRLVEMLENPNPNNHNKFIPRELDDGADELPAMVQVTYLECGGLVFFLGVSHVVGDALSFFMFLDCWATLGRDGTDGIVTPVFDSAKLFPPKDISGFQPRTGINTKGNLVAKRFVFGASAIENIRAMYNDKTVNARPTRVEALSAYIWNRYMAAAAQHNRDQTKTYTVIHAMNLRTRMDPPLSNHYFGNISRPVIAFPAIEKADGVYDIINRTRDAIKTVNAEYIKQLRDGDGHLNFIKTRAESFVRGEMVSFSFTSLCRFPVYVADFGWGKPVWVGSARLTFKNLCSFFDTKDGDGIEAWINLEQEDMDKLEADKEFISVRIEKHRINRKNRDVDIGNKVQSSRIEALSAFIWSRSITSMKANTKHGDEDICFYAVVRAENLDQGINMKLREGSRQHLEFIKERAESFTKGEMILFKVTSLCKFPIYEADFRWRKPVWVSSASLSFKNLVVFMDTVTGYGTEAQINSKEEDMGAFESDLTE
ncbi:hypothetical protein V6N12_036596 [Hibiscus sabdariffa]|uniref:Vinorine synthase-like n=1 Tax=Hibiscus sabdariffa TaxID=183260 RepID=A0ABR2ER20_9ROSI